MWRLGTVGDRIEKHVSETLNASLTTANRPRGGNQIQMWRAKTWAEKRKRALAKQGEAQGGDAASASGGGRPRPVEGRLVEVRQSNLGRLRADINHDQLFYMLPPHSFVPRKSDEAVRSVAEQAGLNLCRTLDRDGSYDAIHRFITMSNELTMPELWWSMLRSRRAMSSDPKVRSVYDLAFSANALLARIRGPTNAYLKGGSTPCWWEVMHSRTHH